MPDIKDYYTEAISASVITMLERPEIVSRVAAILLRTFGPTLDTSKISIDSSPVREELEEYRDFNHDRFHSIKKVQVRYDGNLIMISKLMKDIGYDPSKPSGSMKVYNPVIGCPVGCRYCFTKQFSDHFGLAEDFRKPEFRGPYGFVTGRDGASHPELFDVISDTPIDWFLTSLSDFGCWRPEWQENVFGQLMAATELKKKAGKPLDTYTFLTKCPAGIDLSFIEPGTELTNVVLSCTVDMNRHTDRIKTLIDKVKHFRPTVLITYEPVLDRIEPKYLDELAETFGPENTWVVIGREIGNAAGRVEFEFGFVNDLIDKCLETGIPIKMKPTIMQHVKDAGYDFLEQHPSCMMGRKLNF